MVNHSLHVIRSKSVDPWHNLALEEYLLERVQPGHYTLYLWQNQNTVVIGKNQNPWRECRTQLLEEEGGKLARRLSGGGAVFHDLGNLNFTFLVEREAYHLEKQLQVILSAVKSLGISAIFSGRNDLTVDGRKFSGNAFCLRNLAALHHGTLLVCVDMNKLTRYLQVSQEKMHSKGIPSVQARVTNLVEHQPSLTIEKMSAALIEAFGEVYGGKPSLPEGDEGFASQALSALDNKYASWEWRYGEAPQFDLELSARFPWGGLEIGLQLENGRITKATVYSDAMDEAFIAMIPKALEECACQSRTMAGRIRQLAQPGERTVWANDLANWLAAKGF